MLDGWGGGPARSPWSVPSSPVEQGVAATERWQYFASPTRLFSEQPTVVWCFVPKPSRSVGSPTSGTLCRCPVRPARLHSRCGARIDIKHKRVCLGPSSHEDSCPKKLRAGMTNEQMARLRSTRPSSRVHPGSPLPTALPPIGGLRRGGGGARPRFGAVPMARGRPSMIARAARSSRLSPSRWSGLVKAPPTSGWCQRHLRAARLNWIPYAARGRVTSETTAIV